MSSAWFFRVHSWLGIVTGVFMVAIAWSGSLVVFNDEIEWLLNPAVRANPTDGTKPIDDVLAAIQRRYPEHRAALHFQIGPHWAHTAFVYQRDVTRFLQIDPATADIRSDLAMDGYTFNIAYFLRQLHVRLLMGFWGRVFVGLFGVTLVLSVITSLWIYREWIRSLFRVRRQHHRRIFHMDVHKVVGVWSLAFNLIFGITGGILGLENLYNRLSPSRGDSAAPARDVRVAPLPRDLTPGNTVARLVALDPQFHPTSIEVSPRGPVIVRGDHPGALIAEGASTYEVVSATGEVTVAIDARQARWPTYLYNLLDPLHFGYFGERWGFVTGYLIELLWFIAGLAPGVLSITGGAMWLLRQRQRRAALAARESSPAVASVKAGPGARVAYVTSLLVFVAFGYYLQATVWDRGWALSEVLWQHWIVKPVCLAVVCFPLTLTSLWIGRLALHGWQPAQWPAASGALGAIPLGVVYLMATAVLN